MGEGEGYTEKLNPERCSHVWGPCHTVLMDLLDVMKVLTRYILLFIGAKTEKIRKNNHLALLDPWVLLFPPHSGTGAVTHS